MAIAIACLIIGGLLGFLVNINITAVMTVYVAIGILAAFDSILGAIVATLGVVFPSLVIISILAGLITSFSHIAWVQNAFSGIQICVCVLIFNAVIKLVKKAVVDIPTAIIFIIVMLLGIITNLSPVYFVLLSGIMGVILKSLGGNKK